MCAPFGRERHAALFVEQTEQITLYKRYNKSVYYFNRNIEVDFYIPDEGLAIQASYRMSDEVTIEREIKALVALNSLYTLKKAIIITYEDEGEIERNGLRIEIIPSWKWGLNEGHSDINNDVITRTAHKVNRNYTCYHYHP